MKLKTITAIVTLLLTGLTNAAPVELDTPQYHLVIVRPLDSYGDGNLNRATKSLERFNNKEYGFTLAPKLSRPESDPIRQEVRSLGEKSGWTEKDMGIASAAQYIVLPVSSISGSEANQFMSNQNALWAYRSIELAKKANDSSSGDGSVWGAILDGAIGGGIGAFAGKAIGKAVGGGAGAVLSQGGAASIGASTGVTIGATSSPSSHFEAPKPSQNIDDLLKDNRFGFNRVPAIDYSKFQSVDTRKVIFYGLTGNIIIAYKTEKTEAIETEALISAMPYVMSFDETKPQISLARHQDNADRAKLMSKSE